MKRWNRIQNQPCLPIGKNGTKISGCNEHIALSKQVASEGFVLLKNDNSVLPLKNGSRVALVGKGCADYVHMGGGSGGVNSAYNRSLCYGLEEKANEGRLSLFMPLNELYKKSMKEQYEIGRHAGQTFEPDGSFELVRESAKTCDTAIITISRRTWEGVDIDLNSERNEFYLWKKEKELINLATELFDKIVVVLNVAGVVDASWFANNPKIQSVLVIWNAGMEGGTAAADVLCGDICPSGKLTDTFADIYDYPTTQSFLESKEYVEYTEDIFVGYRYFETIPDAYKKVFYPFGFGLSYTDFNIDNVNAVANKESIIIECDVTNTGKFASKEVVQVYTSSPAIKLQKPIKELRAFKKTKLLAPNETQHIIIEFSISSMSCFDEETASFILEKGNYGVFVGNSIRNVSLVYNYTIDNEITVCKCNNRMIPKKLSKRMNFDGTYTNMEIGEYEEQLDTSDWPKKPLWSVEHILPDLRDVKIPDDKDTLEKVANGEISIEKLVEQMSIEELITLVGGRPNKGVSDTYCIGDLESFGIPSMPTADGPGGVRIKKEFGITTTAWPCATLLACTWNPDLVELVGKAGALEAKENNFGMWLTPALNIHRNPLCGRNFEYYSEDPYVSGVIASAIVKGIQSQNISSCVKHFCCNNKEIDRMISDSRVTERALREIYLRGFEIVVKNAKPWAIMTSYNKVNGIYPSETKALISGILRDEWGYEGLVCTDWTNKAEHYREVLAGNDVRMPTGSNKRLQKAIEIGAVKKSDFEKCAIRVLKLILKLE